jgi:hypothetical protein
LTASIAIGIFTRKKSRLKSLEEKNRQKQKWPKVWNTESQRLYPTEVVQIVQMGWASYHRESNGRHCKERQRVFSTSVLMLSHHIIEDLCVLAVASQG